MSAHRCLAPLGRRLRVPLALGLLVAAPGCASLPFRLPFTGSGLERGFTQEELAEELDAYATRFAGLVSTAGEEIAATSDDPTIRRRTLLWTLRIVPAVQEAAFVPDPRAGYVRVVTIAVMMRRSLSDGDGRALFGAAQPIAVTASELLEEDVFAMARAS